MGYTTNFRGSVTLGRKLTMAEAKELLEIAACDHAQKFTGIDAYFQWVPAETLEHIVWDQNEKFYRYVPQLEWLCKWLHARGILANGLIDWQGEETGDTGSIVVTANQVVSHVAPKKSVKSPKPLTLRALQGMALDLAAAAEQKGTQK